MNLFKILTAIKDKIWDGISLNSKNSTLILDRQLGFGELNSTDYGAVVLVYMKDMVFNDQTLEYRPITVNAQIDVYGVSGADTDKRSISLAEGKARNILRHVVKTITQPELINENFGEHDIPISEFRVINIIGFLQEDFAEADKTITGYRIMFSFTTREDFIFENSITLNLKGTTYIEPRSKEED